MKRVRVEDGSGENEDTAKDFSEAESITKDDTYSLRMTPESSC